MIMPKVQNSPHIAQEVTMKFVSLLISLTLFFLTPALYGSFEKTTSPWVDLAFEQIEIDLNHTKFLNNKGIPQIRKMKTGKILGDPSSLKRDFVHEMASFNKEELRKHANILEPQELKALKQAFGGSFDPTLLSPSLVKSCGFDLSDGQLNQAKKYATLAMNILSSSVINQPLLERFSTVLFYQTPSHAQDIWHPLTIPHESILTQAEVYYKTLVKDKQPIIRFYFYNHDWDFPLTSQTKNENLVVGQINLSTTYEENSKTPKLAFTTTLKGNFLTNVSELKRKKLASEAFKLAGILYAQMAAKSAPLPNETDKILISILGANRVDMAASAAKMFKYVATLRPDPKEALISLRISKALLDQAYHSLDSIHDYKNLVQEAYNRIQKFPIDLTLTEEDFVQDFKFVVGETPQFVMEKTLATLDKESSEESYPALKAWNELMEARKSRQPPETIEDYPNKLITALNYSPNHFPLALERHKNYYNYDTLVIMLAREKKANLSLTFTKALQLYQPIFIPSSSEAPLLKRLASDSTREAAQSEIIVAFKEALHRTLN